MCRRFYPIGRKITHESGQALVLILIVIVIAVVIVFAITARSIQDIRRAGEEKSSDKASAQIESFLDVVTSPTVWNGLSDTLCQQGLPCTISDTQLRDLLDYPQDWQCTNGAEVRIRGDVGINGFPVEKDGALEVDLTSETGSPRSFNVTWTGAAPYLLVKVYTASSVDAAVAFSHDNPSSWSNITAGSLVTFSDQALFARIRPVGGSASVTVTNLETAQTATVKASCYIGDIYRELVRTTKLKPSLPACFDYVLFDANTAVDKVGEL